MKPCYKIMYLYEFRIYREIFALKYILNKENELQTWIGKHRYGSNDKKAYIKFPLINGENLLEYSQDYVCYWNIHKITYQEIENRK